MTFHLIVNCVKSKTLTGGPSIASLKRGQSVAATVHEWKQELQDHTNQLSCPAKNLYKNHLWKLCLETFDAIPDADKKLWIVSAGYGLVHGNAALTSYEATFMSGEPSSIFSCIGHKLGSRVEVLQEWWKLLCQEAQVPGDAVPRSLTQLLEAASPEDKFLFAISQDYLDAIRVDLERGISLSRGQIAVVASTKPSQNTPWLFYVPPQKRRLTSTAEAAKSLVQNIISSEGWNTDKFNEYLVSLQPIFIKEGIKKTDIEVMSFINQYTQKNPKSTKTSLLRLLRAKGLACEQGRFNRLFKQVVSANQIECSHCYSSQHSLFPITSQMKEQQVKILAGVAHD